MRYENVVSGTFLARPNRFIAHVEIGGAVEICHVKNTGRCRELLTPGAIVYLERASSPKRRTQFDLIAVQKGELLINMDAQAPNRVFREFAQSGCLWRDLTGLRGEYTWEDSRFDFLLEDPQGLRFVEVEGVTLEENGVARFPDAPTERGVKHLRGLMRAVEQGYRAAVFFVIQMEGMRCFRPNDDTHPAFGAALREAAAAGVEVLAYECRVTPETLEICRQVPVDLL